MPESLQRYIRVTDGAHRVRAQQELSGCPGEGADAKGAGVGKGSAQQLGQAHISHLCIPLV